MIVTVRKNSRADKIQSDLKKLSGRNKTSRKKRLADFYGKLKGVYGDGLEYQKQQRSEWK